MTDKRFDRPVFIIGAARSGTTVLGDILSTHPDLAYWLEPKYIWRFGNATLAHDVLKASDARKEVKKYIRNRFFDFLNEQGKARFVEKTPSNVFRLPFIYEIFPEARFVHIIRDGRDVVLSAEKKWTSPPDRTALVRRWRRMEIPAKDMFHYIWSFIRDVPGRILFPARGFIWGPQFEGIHEFRMNHSVLETCAMQWLKSMDSVVNDLKAIPVSRQFSFRYEDLLDSPEATLEELCSFLELEVDGLDASEIEKLRKPRKAYSEIEMEKIKEIYPVIKNMLAELNYR